jgi:hypothetical protein
VAIQLRTTVTIGSISQHYQVLLCYYLNSRSILHLHTIPLLDTKYITVCITAYAFASLVPAVEGLWGMHKHKLTLYFSANMDQVRLDLKVIFGIYILRYAKNAALTYVNVHLGNLFNK